MSDMDLSSILILLRLDVLLCVSSASHNDMRGWLNESSPKNEMMEGICEDIPR